MFHRSTDVLLLGFFADDRATGLYRFARQLSDTLLVLFNAMNHVYYPRFLELLAHGRHGQFRHLAGRLLSQSALLMAVVLIVQGLFLPAALGFALAGRFEGAEGAIMVMSLTFLVYAGFQIWMWPLLVHSGRLGVYTVGSYAGWIAQYAVTAALCMYMGPTASAGALGYVSYYLTLFPLMLLLLRKWYPDTVPFGRARAAAA
jgi:O-antigen/teichoic acid export membrane protein